MGGNEKETKLSGSVKVLIDKIGLKAAGEGQVDEKIDGSTFADFKAAIVASKLPGIELSESKTTLSSNHCTLIANAGYGKLKVKNIELDFSNDLNGQVAYKAYRGIDGLIKFGIEKLIGGRLDEVLPANLKNPNADMVAWLNSTLGLKDESRISQVKVFFTDGGVNLQIKTIGNLKEEEKKEMRTKSSVFASGFTNLKQRQQVAAEKKILPTSERPLINIERRTNKLSKAVGVFEENGQVIIRPDKPELPSSGVARGREEEIASVRVGNNEVLISLVDDGKWVPGFREGEKVNNMPYFFRIREGIDSQAAEIESIIERVYENPENLIQALINLDEKWEKVDIGRDQREGNGLDIRIRSAKDELRLFHIGILDKTYNPNGFALGWSRHDKDVGLEVLEDMCQVATVVTNLWLESPIGAGNKAAQTVRPSKQGRKFVDVSGGNKGPTGFDPAVEEISLIGSEPVEGGHITKVEEGVPASRKEGEIPDWLQAMEASVPVEYQNEEVGKLEESGFDKILEKVKQGLQADGFGVVDLTDDELAIVAAELIGEQLPDLQVRDLGIEVNEDENLILSGEVQGYGIDEFSRVKLTLNSEDFTFIDNEGLPEKQLTEFFQVYNRGDSIEKMLRGLVNERLNLTGENRVVAPVIGIKQNDESYIKFESLDYLHNLLPRFPKQGQEKIEEPSWQEKAEARGLEKQARVPARQEFSKGQVVIDRDGYIVIDMDGNHSWVPKEEFLGTDNDRQNIEVKLDDYGNLVAIMNLYELGNGMARAYKDDLENLREMLKDRETIFRYGEEHQWLGISVDGQPDYCQWMLVEKRNNDWVMTKDAFVPVEKLVSRTSIPISVKEDGETQFMLVGHILPGDNTYDHINHLEILHPWARKLQGKFNLQKTKILPAKGEEFGGGDSFHYEDLPLDFVFQSIRDGWRFEVFRRNSATEAEMPRDFRNSIKNFYNRLVAHPVLRDLLRDFSPTLVEASVWMGLAAPELVSQSPGTYFTLLMMTNLMDACTRMLFQSKELRNYGASKYSRRRGGIAAYMLSEVSLVKFLRGRRDIRRNYHETPEARFSQGILTGLVTGIFGGATFQVGLLPHLKDNIYSQVVGRYLTPRLLNQLFLIVERHFNEIDRDNPLTREEFTVGFKLGVRTGTLGGMWMGSELMNILANWDEIMTKPIDIHQAPVMSTPTHTLTATQMATNTPVATNTPGPVAASATPSPIPTFTHAIETATQMVGQEAQNFIHLFDGIKPSDDLSGGQVHKILDNLEEIIQHPDQLSAAHVTKIEGVNRPPLYGIDINNDGIFDYVTTWNRILMQRVGTTDNFKIAGSTRDETITYDQLLGK